MTLPFSRTLLRHSLSLCLPLLALSATSLVGAEEAVSDERITVTGSAIKRVDAEGPSPVQIINRIAIERSGQSTVTDLLRNLTINSGGSHDEQATTSFGAGSASIALRGLSPKNTLLLVDGYRVASNGFTVNTQDTYANLNALPLAAVERIEILKDGASAVYGSDAIAGVVNIILRKDFQGTELTAGYSKATQGKLNERKASLLSGVGDVETDGYNVQFSAEVLDRDQLDFGERDLLRSGDYRSQPGGRLNGWSTLGGAYLSNAGAPQHFPTCQPGTSLRPYSDFGSKLPGEACAYSTQGYNTLQPGVNRLKGSLRGTLKVGDSSELFGEYLYSHNENSAIFGGPLTVGAGLRAYDARTGTLVNIPVSLPVGHPNNPNATATPFEFTFFDLGVRQKQNYEIFNRALVGLRGTAADWDWEASALRSQNSQRELVQNFGNRYAFERLVNEGRYDFLNPAASRAAIDELRINTRRPGFYQTEALAAKASSTLAELPAGALGFATGIEVRREQMDAGTSWQVLSGTELRPAINLVKGERQVSAAFVEFSVPVVDSLELQLAGRGDDYDDFGSAFSPKVALRYTPLDSLLLRGSWSKGFRAPSLPEIAQSSTISYGSVVDPFDPLQPGSRRNFTSVRAGNTELNAEHSVNLTFGAIWSPSADSSIGFDYFQITLDDVIDADSVTEIVANPGRYPDRVQRDAQGRLQIVTNKFTNKGERTVEGVDFDLSQTVALGGYGELKLGGTFSRLLSFREALVAGTPAVDGVGNNLLTALPKWKANVSSDWAKGDWNTRLVANWNDGYAQALATEATNPGLKDRVGSYVQYDLNLSYSGLTDTTLGLSVLNLADADAPFDPAAGGSYFDESLYNARGRTVSVDARYVF